MAGGTSERTSEPDTILHKKRLNIGKRPFTGLTVQIGEGKWFRFRMACGNPGADQICCVDLALVESSRVLYWLSLRLFNGN